MSDTHNRSSNGVVLPMLMKEPKRNIEQTDPSVSGFNVGVNNGRAAGQTVEHCHIRLIPRRVGDVENPVGGIMASSHHVSHGAKRIR